MKYDPKKTYTGYAAELRDEGFNFSLEFMLKHQNNDVLGFDGVEVDGYHWLMVKGIEVVRVKRVARPVYAKPESRLGHVSYMSVNLDGTPNVSSWREQPVTDIAELNEELVQRSFIHMLDEHLTHTTAVGVKFEMLGSYDASRLENLLAGY